ncbi:MAG TPA: helix-turn-helix domain-containing protein [Bryobacteraceae bacterium]|jgi:AraC-like DNA-binding protein|nr:helix-turn-helix domain-containing protein [Bryobacteraceae bacterium]
MHTIRSAMPDPRLKPFVRCFAQREISAQTSSLVETALASLEHIVSFCFSGQPTVDHWSGTSAVVPRIHFFGTQTRSPGCFSFTGSVLAFGIFLKPFASWQLFRIPPAQFADRNFEATEVFGSWITDLWLKLAECGTFSDRVRLATETLLPFAEYAAPPTGTMAVAESLLQAESGMRIEQLARESCMTLRTFERKFVGEMGLSPKLFARLRRFQMALDRKRALGTRWLDVAHDLGYFDQMHMVKEFWAFGGEAPSRLLQSCGDYQPWSIGAPLSLNNVMNHVTTT